MQTPISVVWKLLGRAAWWLCGNMGSSGLYCTTDEEFGLGCSCCGAQMKLKTNAGEKSPTELNECPRGGWSLLDRLACAVPPVRKPGKLQSVKCHKPEEREVNRENKSIDKYCLLPLAAFLLGGKKNKRILPIPLLFHLCDFSSSAEVREAVTVELGTNWELWVILLALQKISQVSLRSLI